VGLCAFSGNFRGFKLIPSKWRYLVPPTSRERQPLGVKFSILWRMIMIRRIIWSNQADTGLEHFCLRRDNEQITADGIVIGVEENIAFRIRYQIHCDLSWNVRKVIVKSLEENDQTLSFVSDGLGNWTNESGNLISELDGCLDVDITATPFTNTLPIRRLNLRSGQSAEIKVVYFRIPEMQVNVEPQRYTCLETASTGGKYKFESLNDGFTAVITVDADGFVEDYPELFKRVWMS
jgi:hypothetical protein